MTEEHDITDAFKGEAEEFSQTTTHWTTELDNLVTGYRTSLRKAGIENLGHAVQKDAVQNCWDARLEQSANVPKKPWKVTFQLYEDTALGYPVLTFTDEGTTGLTGKHIEEADMPDDLPDEERWARYENKAWTKNDTRLNRRNLGSRGRGKFIFCGASKKKQLVYDSLRYDVKYDASGKPQGLDYSKTSYKLGFRYFDGGKSPYISKDADDAAQRLESMFLGLLKPLDKPGMRVVIIDPLDEIIDAIKKGEMEKWIGETFWQLIEKDGAEIILKYADKEVKVKAVPKFPEVDAPTYDTWIKENVDVHRDLRNKHGLKCVKLHIVCNANDDVPVTQRGIAIIRSGMKIMSYKTDFIPQEYRNKIKGYVILEEEWDPILKSREDQDHYEIDFSFGVAGAGSECPKLAHFLREEIDKFGNEKLGWDGDAKAKMSAANSDAAAKAKRVVNKLAEKLGMFGGGGGGGGGGDEVDPALPFRIKFPRLLFPDQTNYPFRVNWGEEVKEINISVINETKTSYNVRVNVDLMLGQANKGRVFESLVSEDLELPAFDDPNQESEFEILKDNKKTFTKEDFPTTGRYTLRARVIQMEHGDNKGEILLEKSKAIYLEEDAPQKGLYEHVDGWEPAPEQDEEGNEIPVKKESVVTKGSHEGYDLKYNIKHPEYEAIEESPDAVYTYLVRLMIQNLVIVDLRQGEGKQKIFTDNILNGTDTLQGKELMVQKVLDFLAQGLFDYREEQ